MAACLLQVQARIHTHPLGTNHVFLTSTGGGGGGPGDWAKMSNADSGQDVHWYENTRRVNKWNQR